MVDSGINKKKVLFVAEAVTLAHMARPVVLAEALNGTEFEAVLAADPRFMKLFPSLNNRLIEIHSLPSEEFLRRLAGGQALYDEATLERYVEEDLSVLESEQPDLVVGDFRLSLSISARLKEIPYLAISNAYWSQYADVAYPIPELPLVRIAGPKIAQTLFNLVRPIAFSLHARALNNVRVKFGLAPLGNLLQRVYTDADKVLYADIPQLIPMRPLPPSHHYLGPVLWSPLQSTKPAWWNELDESLPTVYLSLGTSGRSELLPDIIEGLSELPINVIVSTAGRSRIKESARNFFQSEYLPGDEVTARSTVVISNGGSLASYQALTYGIPVIGISSNLDQHLNMQAIENMGAGIRLRSDTTSPTEIVNVLSHVLDNPSFAERARMAASWIAEYPCDIRFLEVLRGLHQTH